MVWALVTGTVLRRVAQPSIRDFRVKTNGDIVAASAYMGDKQTILYRMKDLTAHKDCLDEIWSRRLVGVDCDCLNKTKIVSVSNNKVVVNNFWV